MVQAKTLAHAVVVARAAVVEVAGRQGYVASINSSGVGLFGNIMSGNANGGAGGQSSLFSGMFNNNG